MRLSAWRRLAFREYRAAFAAVRFSCATSLPAGIIRARAFPVRRSMVPCPTDRPINPGRTCLP
jgi:hypothetical protein